MPLPGLATERFTPYTGYLLRSSINPTVIKQESGTTPSRNTECTAWNPSHRSSGTIAAAATRWLDSQETQSTQQKTVQGPVQNHFGSGTASWSPSAGVPYSWAYKYTPHYATVLAGEIPAEHLSRADRKDFLKVLEAAKATIFELMPEERRIELNLDEVPADYTGLMKIARELDLIIPFEFIPLGPDIFPMDRIIRALQAYIGRLRLGQKRLRKDAARAEHRTASDPQLASCSEPSNVIDKEIKNGNLSEARKGKVKGKKGKPRSSEDQTSVPKIQNNPKASKKRKHESDTGAKEDRVAKSSKKKKQKRSAPAIEQEMPEPETKEPKARNKQKKKQPKIPCTKTEDDVPDEVITERKKKKNTSPPPDDNVPEPATENREKKTKKSSVADEEEPSEHSHTETNPPKGRRKRKNLTPVEEEPSGNLPEQSFDADASFLGEALETTEEKNHNLNQEIQNLKAILQAFGVTGARLSVALTRMRHGQSAAEIFMGVKREGRED